MKNLPGDVATQTSSWQSQNINGYFFPNNPKVESLLLIMPSKTRHYTQ
jgi:hypothetical protein